MVDLQSISKPDAHVAPAPEPRRVLQANTGNAGALEKERGASRLLNVGRIAPLLGKSRSVPGSVIDADDRVRVVDTELTPWRMVCALRITAPTGTFLGSGWLAGRRTVITAGHCIFDANRMGGWAQQIQVTPGQDEAFTPFGSASSVRFSTVDAWLHSQDPDFDIGAIHLGAPLGDEVGWFAVGALPAPDLPGFGINVSGYPADKGGRQQWHHGNRILSVGPRRIFYDQGTFGGQSGAPAFLYEQEGGDPIVVGVHADVVGGTPGPRGIPANSAPRILPEVLEQIEKWVAADA